MTPHTTTRPAEAVPAQRRRLSELFRAWRGDTRPRPALWALLAVALVLDLGAVGLGVWLVGFTVRTLPPPAGSRLAVPLADDAGLWEPLHRWVVQEDGRFKPFETFCAESVRAVTGRERFEGNDPVAVVASWLLLCAPDEGQAGNAARRAGCDWDDYPFILCDHHELRAALYAEYRGLEGELSEKDRHGRYIEPNVLRGSQTLRKLVQRGAARTEQDARATVPALERKAAEVHKRLGLYDRIRRGGGLEGPNHVAAPGEFRVAGLDRESAAWLSLQTIQSCVRQPDLWPEVVRTRRAEDTERGEAALPPFPAAEAGQLTGAFAALATAYQGGERERVAAALADFLTVVDRINGAAEAVPDEALIERERWFNHHNPFGKAWRAGLLASVLLTGGLAVARYQVAGRVLYGLGVLAYVGCLGWAVLGFACRVSISGRPPVSNMYESIVWVAFMTAVFGLVLEGVYRRGVIALAGAVVSTLGFVLADQLPLTFSPAIQPLQAVLRSNYWLVIHVLTIVSSYAAFALAWGLGNLTLALIVLAPGRRDRVRTLARFVYRAIQVGVVLLAAGTLLGGFWAAESWGRFWGWDPKEVWALIALLCYVIPLHARHVGWVRDFGMALCAVACFASVVMAWYGVNFVLGTGLHSYGFGGGDDAWVYWAGLVNLALAAHAALRHLRAQGARPLAV